MDRTPQSNLFVTKSLVYVPSFNDWGAWLHTCYQALWVESVAYVRELHRFGYFCRIPTHTRVKNRVSLRLDGLHGRENALEILWVGDLSISI